MQRVLDERRLVETEERYRRLVEASPDAIVVYSKGRITFANAAAVSLSNGEGNGYIVGKFGFMLNNMLGEEDIASAALGDWRPGTRLSSMMAPTIILQKDGSVTALGTGELHYRGPGTEGWLAVQGGFAEVLGERVTVLAELAERPEEIDVAAAQELRSRAEAGLRTATPERLEELGASHRLALTRLAVAARKRT